MGGVGPALREYLTPEHMLQPLTLGVRLIERVSTPVVDNDVPPPLKLCHRIAVDQLRENPFWTPNKPRKRRTAIPIHWRSQRDASGMSGQPPPILRSSPQHWRRGPIGVPPAFGGATHRIRNSERRRNDRGVFVQSGTSTALAAEHAPQLHPPSASDNRAYAEHASPSLSGGISGVYYGGGGAPSPFFCFSCCPPTCYPTLLWAGQPGTNGTHYMPSLDVQTRDFLLPSEPARASSGLVH